MQNKGKARKSITFDLNDERQKLAFHILDEKGRNAAAAFVTEAVLILEGLRLEKIKKMLDTEGGLNIPEQFKKEEKAIPMSVNEPREEKTENLRDVTQEEESLEEIDPVRMANLEQLLELRK